MATINIYPSAGDGIAVRYSATPGDWSNVIAATDATSIGHATSPMQCCFAAGGGIDTYCSRAFFPFDTSSISGKVTAVTFHGYITTFDATETWYVVPSTQASATEIVVGDYSKIDKGTSYGNVSMPDFDGVIIGQNR